MPCNWYGVFFCPDVYSRGPDLTFGERRGWKIVLLPVSLCST